MPLVFWLSLFSFLLCACSHEVPELRVQVTVRDDQGVAQVAVPIELDGRAVAATDPQGRASLTYQAHANRARISAHCAEGYHSPEPRSVPLARHGRQPPLELDFVCRPALRSLLLVVRAPLAAGLPVLADGEPLGTVSPDGTLHAVLKKAPDTELRITLDTTAVPTLVPQHPVREIKVTDEDQIVVFDQALSFVAKKVRRTRERERPEPDARHIPFAIGARY